MFYSDDPRYVSTKPSAADPRTNTCYKTVPGHVFLDWKNMPDAPYGLPANTVREGYYVADNDWNFLATHSCSYACYFSQNVDVKYNRCLFPQNATSTQVPADVKQYGLCFFPPPELPGDAVFGIDRFYFP